MATSAIAFCSLSSARFYMMSPGIADLATLDRAIMAGPAIRWAVMGPSAVFFLGARDTSLYPEFVELLSNELRSGYIAPPSFEPDTALLLRYAKEVLSGIGAAGQDELIARRDAGVASIRAALAVLTPSQGHAAQ